MGSSSTSINGFHVQQVRNDSAPASKTSKADEFGYVGTAACIECHKTQHAGFLSTLHSKSFRAIKSSDADNAELPESMFGKTDIEREYAVKWRDGSLVHSEKLVFSNLKEVTGTQRSIEYAIGSGDHAKSFIHRDGDFHFQSPLTWYRNLNAYDLSPGYKESPNISFSRNVTASCLFCHVGRLDRQVAPRHPYRFEVVEESIGCERCHGPGERHVEKHRTKSEGILEEFVVHPGKLSRDLAEAICQQCHLQGDAKVNRSGKDDWDFRPGQFVSESRVDFRIDSKQDVLPLVGHVEQMHQSACYQGSETFTCTTCHDPHQRPEPDQRAAFYRGKCYECHKDEACGESLKERNRTANNDCTSCHMPRLSVHKQSHLALHQHRVGLYPTKSHYQKTKAKQAVVSAAKQVKGAMPADLRMMVDKGDLTQTVRDRNQALAVYQLARVPTDSIDDPAAWATTAIEKLIALEQNGDTDEVCSASLAWLAQSQGQSGIAGNLASELLQRKNTSVGTRIEALRVLGQYARQSNEEAGALKVYRELNKLCCDASDAFHLGVYEEKAGDRDAARKAYERSIDLNPFQTAAYVQLALLFNADGQEEAASEMLSISSYMQTHLERLRKRAGQPKVNP